MDGRSILGLAGLAVIALTIGLAAGSYATEIALGTDGEYAIATLVATGLVLVTVGGLSALGRAGDGPAVTPYW